MPGWLILVGKDADPKDYVGQGVYGTYLKETDRLSPPHLKTLADYATMRGGDLVFFFQSRLIYGVGQLVDCGTGDPVACNWPESDDFTLKPPKAARNYLWAPDSASRSARWILTFRPAPSFLRVGIDMDAVLGADRVNTLHHLRVLSGRSFFKLEDSECRQLLDALLRRNGTPSAKNTVAFTDRTLAKIRSKLTSSSVGHRLEPRRTVMSTVRNGTFHELAVQTWIARALAERRLNSLLGDWDYIGNFEPASPLKPREYMDEMDLFGYARAQANFGNQLRSYVVRYFVIEVKGRKVDLDLVVRQALKYVDWVAHERVAGDYDMVRAFVVAPGVPAADAKSALRDAVRKYVEPTRPFDAREWKGLSILGLSEQSGDIELAPLAGWTG